MERDAPVLPAFLIADLYKDVLVEIPDVSSASAGVQKNLQSEVEVPPPAGLPAFLGKNNKNVIVVVRAENSAFIDDTELQFLTNILSACQLTINDIAIYNQLKQDVVFNELKEAMNAKCFLLFGIEPQDISLPFSIPNFQVQQYAGCTILVAPALNLMNTGTPESTSLKRELWTSLQLCFNLKPGVNR